MKEAFKISMVNHTKNQSSDLVRKTISGLPGAVHILQSLAFVHWRDVVGEKAADASEPEDIRDGTLIVRTKSSVWSNELNLLKTHIIVELNRKIGANVITNIAFKAKGLRKKDATPSGNDEPSEQELQLLILPEDEKSELVRDLASLAEISNEDLRVALETKMIHDRKLRRWRLNHGWKKCNRCTAVHNTGHSVCPICRLNH